MAKDVDERRDSNDPFTPVIVKSGLTPEEAFTLREAESQLPGVEVWSSRSGATGDSPSSPIILGYVGAGARR